MKLAILLVLSGACALNAQRTTDWWTFGGDAQRENWGKNEQSFTRDDVRSFRLLWQRKLNGGRNETLFPPVVLGRLIGYRGFKELAFIAGSDNTIWAIDADLDQMYWTKHFDIANKSGKGKNCSDKLTAVPVLPGPVVFRTTRTHETAGQRKARSAASRFGRAEPVYVLTGDGILRQVNQADGDALNPPVAFLHSGAVAQPLVISEDTVFTATQAGCGEEAAVWSIDTSEPTAQPRSFELGADVAGMAGVALGANGMIFVRTRAGALDPNARKYGDSVVALNPDLTLNDYFVMPAGESNNPAHGPELNETGPILFKFKDEEMVVTANQDGRLYILKASGVGSDDHHHYLSRSMVIPQLDGRADHGIWGGLSSWQDTDGTRYVLAPVWGPLSEEVRAALPGIDAPNGSIVAFKLSEDSEGAPALTPAWVSRDLESPVPPVIAKGVVFALANGKYSMEKMRPQKDAHATLYVLDAATGKEIYSTGDQVKAAGNLTGLTVVNGRAYFTTVDNTVQVFGKYLEP